jgi:hypothetical protein
MANGRVRKVRKVRKVFSLIFSGQEQIRGMTILAITQFGAAQAALTFRTFRTFRSAPPKQRTRAARAAGIGLSRSPPARITALTDTPHDIDDHQVFYKGQRYVRIVIRPHIRADRIATGAR